MDGIEEDVYEDAVSKVTNPKKTSILRGFEFTGAIRQRACGSWIQ